MADPYAIEEEINRILNTKWSKAKGSDNFTAMVNSIPSLPSQAMKKVGKVGAVRSFGANAGSDPIGAYLYAKGKYEQAGSEGDTGSATFWNNAMTSLGASLGDLDGGGGGGDPYGYANALAGIYGTAAQLGTAKASAAAKKLEAALEQAQMTQQSDYVAGWEPRGIVSGALNTPWGGIGEAGKYTKVSVDSPDTITQSYDSAFQDTLNALLGSLGGGSGSSGAGGSGELLGGGTAAPVDTSSTGSMPPPSGGTHSTIGDPTALHNSPGSGTDIYSTGGNPRSVGFEGIMGGVNDFMPGNPGFNGFMASLGGGVASRLFGNKKKRPSPLDIYRGQMSNGGS